MTQTFEYADGRLCLVTRDTLSDEPIEIVAHYPFGKVYHSDCEHLLGKPAIAIGNGIYACHLSGQCLEFRLESGGATLPVKFEKLPVAKPVSKRETRWHLGGWQMKFATGWKSYVPTARMDNPNANTVQPFPKGRW